MDPRVPLLVMSLAIPMSACGGDQPSEPLACIGEPFYPLTVRVDWRRLELLLVISPSNSMATEIAAFSEQLPMLLEALGSGDIDGDGRLDMRPLHEVRVGVITTDMGTGGFSVPTCDEPRFGEDGVFRTETAALRPGCPPVGVGTFSYHPGEDDPFEVATAIECVMPEAGGCGWSQ
ncbi:MAG: hypothetical protein JRH11_28350, partial [Deltaproteobacteria bacterium]|nr:hypothetical protein [Deltaproteobacteria bacterium]